MINPNAPAMPQIETELKTHGYGTYPWSDVESKGGLTIRQQFAMAAMQGLLSNTDPRTQLGEKTALSVAQDAVFAADALIDELNKDQPRG